METQDIADLIDRIMTGDPWHGPSVRQVLAGIDARAAALRPVPQAHSIWEIVLHMTGWAREVTARLGGRAAREPEEGDWPAPSRLEGPDTGDANAARWAAAQSALFKAHDELATAVRRFDAARLREPVRDFRSNALGTGLSHYLTLHGVAQHTVYHAGQIAVLKKGLGL